MDLLPRKRCFFFVEDNEKKGGVDTRIHNHDAMKNLCVTIGLVLCAVLFARAQGVTKEEATNLVLREVLADVLELTESVMVPGEPRLNRVASLSAEQPI